MAHKIYDNFYLSNEVEDQFNSHLDLQQFCTVDNSLVGTAGMKRKINVYKATSMLMKSMHWKRTSLPSIPTVSRGLTALLLPMPPMVIRWISKNSIVWREQSLTFTTGSLMRVREGGHSHGILV